MAEISAPRAQPRRVHCQNSHRTCQQTHSLHRSVLMHLSSVTSRRHPSAPPAPAPLLPVHITMCHHAHRIQCRILRQTPCGCSASQISTAVFPVFVQSKITMFDRHLLRIDTQPGNFRNTFRQPLRIHDRYAIARATSPAQSADCARSHRLRIPPSRTSSVNPRPFDKRFAARDHRSHRRAQSLR